MKKNLYLFSGLGADERVFQKLILKEHKVHFIKWIDPQKNEDLAQYAGRLTEQITAENPVLIGLSFGGIVSVEVSKIIAVEKIILISSIQSYKELPFYYKWASIIKIQKLIPISLFKKVNWISNYLFGINNAEEKILLKKILKDTNNYFLEWAINHILCWKNEYMPENLVRIHGSKDRLFPIHGTNQINYRVENGGHFMVFNKAEEIEGYILETLNKISK